MLHAVGFDHWHRLTYMWSRGWQVLQTPHTLEPQLVADRYQVRILKERFSVRRLPDTILEVADEVTTAVRQRITATDNGGSEPGFHLLVSTARASIG